MKVAIAGYGVEGEANYRYWSALGADVKIFDAKKSPDRPLPDGAKSFLGPEALQQMQDFDLVVRTASLNPNKIKTDGKIWSATNEFFTKCPAPIIGVTGTKGKGTTCSLIAEILRSDGKTVHLVGNIGVPALEVLPSITSDDIVVFELSSFQLWDLKKSPHISVILMIEPDHLDVHSSMQEYVNAKANIVKYQDGSDSCVYNPKNEFSRQIALTSLRKQVAGAEHTEISSKFYTYGTPEQEIVDEVVQEAGVYIEDGYFYKKDQKICAVNALQLLGEHNKENACAAITVCLLFSPMLASVDKGLRSFKGLPHRLEFVREVEGVKYYNDSQATGPGSCVAALRSFGNEEVALILGGSDKGTDISLVIDELTDRHKVILVGESSQKIEALLKKRNFKNYINLGSGYQMTDIVASASEKVKNGGVVLLSPAHASFDMFSSYQDRGEQFRDAVAQL